MQCSTRGGGVAKEHNKGFSENPVEGDVFTLVELFWSDSRINKTRT